MKMKLLNHILEAHFGARRKWSSWGLYDHSYYKHFVWGRLSLTWGQPHLEPLNFCAVCLSPECQEVGYGDEGWTVCPDCGSIEQGYLELTYEEAEARGLV